jgi:hypothetical protein
MPKLLTNTLLWFRIMWGWLCDQLMLWLALAGLGVAAAVVMLWPWDGGSDRIRYAGTLLQVAGFITVWLGIDETRQLFGYKRSFTAFWEWLRRCPWRGPRIIHGNANITVGLGGLSATGSVGTVTPSGLTTEQRLDALTKRVDEMQRAHAAEIGKVREDLNRTNDALGQESDERRTTTKLNELLKHAQTGGLDMSLGGLVWLAVGVVATCIPDELARWFGISCAQ